MSTMQLLPRTGREQSLMERIEGRPARMETESKPHPTDEEMMYAWSIGVVTTTQQYADQRSGDDCPPEVYIG